MVKNHQGYHQLPFWLFTFSILVGLTLPTLIQDGMFMDAMLYTAVSHNQSIGIGTFWFPQFSYHNIAGLSSFHEQPPLVFGIQSLFFRFLGSSMYVERFYTFVTLVLTAILIIVLWKSVFHERKDLQKAGWLPVLLWITIPVCFWSYSNNMHENTMGIFTLCSVLFGYQAMRSEKFKLPLLLTSGSFIFLATLSKGFPGLFPIVVPVLYWLTTKKTAFSKALLQTAVLALVPLLAFGILFTMDESRESLSIYLFKRALHRISEVPTVDNRFYILGRLVMELLPQIIFVVLFVVISQLRKKKTQISAQIRESLFFITVGLSASVPLMLTMVQKGFYFVPALPFFAIGLSMLIAPVVAEITGRIEVNSVKYKVILIAGLFLFIGALAFTFMKKGEVRRDKEMLHDVYVIGDVVPARSIVTLAGRMSNEWELQCYLIRYFNISLDTDPQKYCIRQRTNLTDSISGYKKVNISTMQYDLYQQQ